MAHHPDPVPTPPWNHSHLSLESYIFFIVLTLLPQSSALTLTIQSRSPPTQPPGLSALAGETGHRLRALSDTSSSLPLHGPAGSEDEERAQMAFLCLLPPSPTFRGGGSAARLGSRGKRPQPSAAARPERVPSCEPRAPRPAPSRGAAQGRALTPAARPCSAAAPRRRRWRARRS